LLITLIPAPLCQRFVSTSLFRVRGQGTAFLTINTNKTSFLPQFFSSLQFYICSPCLCVLRLLLLMCSHCGVHLASVSRVQRPGHCVPDNQHRKNFVRRASAPCAQAGAGPERAHPRHGREYDRVSQLIRGRRGEKT